MILKITQKEAAVNNIYDSRIENMLNFYFQRNQKRTVKSILIIIKDVLIILQSPEPLSYGYVPDNDSAYRLVTLYKVWGIYAIIFAIVYVTQKWNYLCRVNIKMRQNPTIHPFIRKIRDASKFLANFYPFFLSPSLKRMSLITFEKYKDVNNTFLL